jgi:hypothetical protein
MSIAAITTPTRQAQAVSSHRTHARMATVLLAGLALAGTVEAQTAVDTTARSGWEFMMSSGALVPTGVQRRIIKDAQLSTAQLSYVIRARVAVTAMAGWARSRDIASTGDPKLDVFTYDVGAEVRAPRWATTARLALTPIAGIGVGTRSYNYRSRDVDATHNVAAYGTVGAEVGARRARLRLEVRDYVSGFKPLAGGGESATRNDLVAMLGLRLVRRGR